MDGLQSSQSTGGQQENDRPSDSRRSQDDDVQPPAPSRHWECSYPVATARVLRRLHIPELISHGLSTSLPYPRSSGTSSHQVTEASLGVNSAKCCRSRSILSEPGFLYTSIDGLRPVYHSTSQKPRSADSFPSYHFPSGSHLPSSSVAQDTEKSFKSLEKNGCSGRTAPDPRSPCKDPAAHP